MAQDSVSAVLAYHELSKHRLPNRYARYLNFILCADEGDRSVELRGYLINMAEPGVRMQVSKATSHAGALSIDLDLHPAYLPDEVWVCSVLGVLVDGEAMFRYIKLAEDDGSPAGRHGPGLSRRARWRCARRS